MKELPLYLVLIVIGYLLGSIPTGQIAGALLGGVDLRRYGSGKTGATNVLRTLGWGPAVAVVAGDLAKGIAAVLLARWLVHDPNARHIAEVLAGSPHHHGGRRHRAGREPHRLTGFADRDRGRRRGAGDLRRAVPLSASL